MGERQYATPVLIQDGKVVTLHRAAFGDDFHDEDWIQELLFSHPELIPFEELEPAFKGSVPVAREVESGAGPVDVLCVNAEGLLTVVETKLWRNPQSRREVVSQLIDYAAGLSKLEYEDLDSAIADATGLSGGLIGRMKARGLEVNPKHFHDAISQNLRRGKFLLLAIGDGIQEGVEAMADFLQGQPQLGFTLRLIEMAMFRLDPSKNDPIFVQPRIVARTREVVRAVIELKGDNRIEVSTPPEDSPRTAKRYTITEDEFYRKLSDNVTADEVAFVKHVCEEAPKHQLDVHLQSLPLLKYTDRDTGELFSFGGFDRDGYLTWEYALSSKCISLGLPDNIWTEYLDTLVRIIPGTKRVAGTKPEEGGRKPFVKWEYLDYAQDVEPSVKAIMANEAEWWSAIDKVVLGIQRAMAKRPV
jgi:hypothetical protein